VTIGDLTERFKALGIERQHLPENLTDYFGVFASERQNVIRGVDFVRQSPLIGPRMTVHGLLVDIQSGQLEWIVNGYDVLARPSLVPANLRLPTLGGVVGELVTGAGFNFGEMKFPDSKIGETASASFQSLSAPKIGAAASPLPAPPPVPPPLPPPPMRARALPIPPPIQLHSGDRGKRR
jgi:carbonic anhydrase